jgi:hypothetical protein
MSGIFLNGASPNFELLSKVGIHHDKVKSTRRRSRISKRRQERALKAQQPKPNKPTKGFK